MKIEEVKTPEQLLDFMNSRIKYGFIYEDEIYSSEDENKFQNGVSVYWTMQDVDDTLETKYGIDFDQVEFERDWFIKHNYEIKQLLIMLEINEAKASISHPFLLFKEKGKWNLFENAFDYNKGIFTFNFINEAIFFEINKYIEANKDIIEYEDLTKYIKVYEYTDDLTYLPFDEVMERIIEDGIDMTGTIIVDNNENNYLEDEDEN